MIIIVNRVDIIEMREYVDLYKLQSSWLCNEYLDYKHGWWHEMRNNLMKIVEEI